MRYAWLVVLVACGSRAPVPQEPPIEDEQIEGDLEDPDHGGCGDSLCDDGTPRESTPAEDFLGECAWPVRITAPQLHRDLLELEGVAAVEAYNKLLFEVSRSANTGSLYGAVAPDEAIREAARTCEQEASKFVTALMLDRKVYDLLAAVAPEALPDADARRFLEHTLRDFRRQGVDLPDDQRARLQVLSEEITQLGQTFEQNIAEDVRSITVTDETRLGGLPEDYLAARRQPDGSYVFTTNYPDYFPFMTYADDDALRNELYLAFRSLGDAKNPQVLLDLLAKRREYAQLLGFDHFADFAAADEMMQSAANAKTFLARVTKLAKKRGQADYKELLAQLRKHDKKAKRVEDWQKTWLEQQVQKAKYAVDPAVVRTYFPYRRVLDGLLAITAKIYDLEYVPTEGEPWADGVLVYDVRRGDRDLGRIYLDMHPREGKYKHAAQFNVVEGITGRTRPEGALICNFPSGDEPMEHDDVVTMFHEFGHLMHHILGGDHPWITQTGTAVEHDFVEAPSQMFEEWAWSHATLAQFAQNADGEGIPEALVAKMRKADGFGRGTRTLQQMFYAALSLELYTADPATLDPAALEERLQGEYTPFRHVDGASFYSSFGHLVGYASKYYTYMWSLVIAKDLLTPFAKPGLLDTKTTYRYRDAILVPGGTKDAADLVHDFLGRDWKYDAFEKWLKG